MPKDILMIAHFCGDFDGGGNNRFNYIADLLSQSGFDVELVTSDFSHSQKKKRREIGDLLNFQVTMCHEPHYTRNVSLKRFYSHFVMGRNLKKYLRNRKKPDVVYCAVPSLDVAKVAAEYANKNGIRFIIDIQDLWPEAFRMAFNVPLISDILFQPLVKQANYIYKAADEIIGVSETYTERALQVNNKSHKKNYIFIGTELATFDKLAKENKIIDKPNEEIWLGYVGTLGHSYDLTCTIDALKILQEKGISNVKFVIMGDGPLKSKFELYAKNNGIYAEFTGGLDYGKMAGKLTACDMAINPISCGSSASIINKHADYAAAGLPVLNTQESKEYRDLIDRYEAGINCKNNDAADLANKLLKLYQDAELRMSMGRNSRRLAENKFDRKKTYIQIRGIVLND